MRTRKMWVTLAVVAALVLAVGGSALAAGAGGPDKAANGAANQYQNLASPNTTCLDGGDQLQMRDGTGENCDGHLRRRV